MKTPKRLSPAQFFEALETFLAAHCSTGEGTPGLICKYCKSKIMSEHIAVPLHESDLDRCVETGNVQILRIPYCPRCEESPSFEGCIHVLSFDVWLEWCAQHKELSEFVLIKDRRRGHRESGEARRKLVREYLEGDVTPDTHHGFGRADVHQVLSDFEYWVNDRDGDSFIYVRRGGKDYIATHRLDGSWHHIIPGGKEVEGEGGASLKEHLGKSVKEE